MDPDGALQIAIMVALIIMSGCFSASETALTSINKLKARRLTKDNSKGDLINLALEETDRFLSGILIGNNIVNITASSLATYLLVQYFGSQGVIVATILMTVMLLIFGEITPKILAVRRPESVLNLLIRPLNFVLTLFKPFVFLTTKIADLALKLFGFDEAESTVMMTEEELKTMVDVSHEEGVLEEEEKEMIHNVVAFGDSQMKKVMTPRMDIVAIDYDSTYEEIISIFKNEQFSRMPVYKDSMDNIIGILHVKGLLFFDDNTEFKIDDHIRQPYFVYEFGNAMDILQEMRKGRIPMAIILDEYGGTSGIVTIEDIVEEIVGEISDEYDEPYEITVISDDEYLLNGNTKISLVNDTIRGLQIDTEDFDSIGGFVVGLLGKVPKLGETIAYQNCSFIIENIGRNRIDQLRLKLTS